MALMPEVGDVFGELRGVFVDVEKTAAMGVWGGGFGYFDADPPASIVGEGYWTRYSILSGFDPITLDDFQYPSYVLHLGSPSSPCSLNCWNQNSEICRCEGPMVSVVKRKSCQKCRMQADQGLDFLGYYLLVFSNGTGTRARLDGGQGAILRGRRDW